MPTIEIPFGEFLPSQPTTKNPGCVIADNVIPAEGGYAPFRGAVRRPQGVSGKVMGAELLFRPDGSPFIVGGTGTTLFTRYGTTQTNQGGFVVLPDGAAWDFAQFNNFVIATSPSNPPQYIANYVTGDMFIPLSGNPPRARYVERFADFLMMGNIDGAESRIQWSSFNSPAGDWTPSRMTQAGFADLNPRFGPVMSMSGGRYPMVFQQRAVHLLQYVGPPTVWSVSLVSEDRGCIAPSSVVTVGAQTYFLSQDGFWMTNGSEFLPIGSQKVNSWFFDNADNATLSYTQGTVDWRNKCIIWAFRTVTNGGNAFDKCMIYSWEQNSFSTATLQIDRLVGSRIDATSLEDLDALFASLEDVTPNLDSNEWMAGDRVLAAFIRQGNTAFYNTMNGANMEAQWETGSFQPMAGMRGFITEAQAVFDATDWVMQASVGMLDNQRSIRYTDYNQPGVNGSIPLRADGKELRLAVHMPQGAQWSKAVGMQITFRPSGKR